MRRVRVKQTNKKHARTHALTHTLRLRGVLWINGRRQAVHHAFAHARTNTHTRNVSSTQALGRPANPLCKLFTAGKHPIICVSPQEEALE